MHMNCYSRWAISGMAGCLIGLLMTEASGQCLTNNITNIVWRADVRGAIAKQNYDQGVIPYIQTARFNTRDFLGFVLGRVPTATEVLALNLDLRAGTTNIYLTVFDTRALSNTVFVSVPANALTTVQIDCTNLSFAVEAPIPPQVNGWLGGNLQIAGQGKLGANGVAPVRVRGDIRGLIVDQRPADLGGTTAVVTRASIKIRGEPLRVQPPIVP